MTPAEPVVERLFDGKRLRLTLFCYGHRKLLVSFDNRMASRKGFAEVAPLRAFARSGFDQLALRVSKNDWFINDETEAVEAIMSQLAGEYDEVITFGFSMGGYGAFRFAKPLGASRILAVSPQWSIHPEDVPNDPRYRKDAHHFDRALGAIPPTGAQGIIMVDPFNRLDLWHSDRLLEMFPGVRRARVGFAGHPAGKVLTKTGRYPLLLKAITAPTPDRDLICHAHREARRESPDYFRNLAKYADTRRPEVASKARRLARRTERQAAEDQ